MVDCHLRGAHRQGAVCPWQSTQRPRVHESRAECVIPAPAELPPRCCRTQAQDIIDETRTSAFGLEMSGLRSFLDAERHPSACYDLAELAGDCCDLDSAARPSVTDVLSRIEMIRAEFVTGDSLSA